MYEPRFYRNWTHANDLVSFSVVLKETDLLIQAKRNLRRKALRAVTKYRNMLERYVEHHPEFLAALEPVAVEEDAPQIARAMARAAADVHVGPMASVAGAIAESVGRELLPFSREVIVENGGDIFIQTQRTRLVGIYAGEESPITGSIALQVQPQQTPLGVCTSSGTVGHSLSFGRADACVVLSPSTALADAAATAIGNMVTEAGDIGPAIDFAKSVPGLTGVLIVSGEQMGIWGEVEVVPVGG